MNKSLLAGFAFALCASTLPAPMRAEAGPAAAVQQCRTADGTTLFTDKPCRIVGAQAVPMRGELATRIVREQVLEASVSGVYESVEPPAPNVHDTYSGACAFSRAAVRSSWRRCSSVLGG